MRSMAYRDRDEAGVVLAGELQGRVSPTCVVVGIPRGGVVVAGAVARRLDCPSTLRDAGGSGRGPGPVMSGAPSSWHR